MRWSALSPSMELKGKYVEEMFRLYEDCITALTLSMKHMMDKRAEILERAEKDSGIILPPTL